MPADDPDLARFCCQNRRCTLYGARDAGNLTPWLTDVPIVASAHPSPMSADRGFFGSRPFSRVNQMLEEIGGEPVDWKLP